MDRSRLCRENLACFREVEAGVPYTWFHRKPSATSANPHRRNSTAAASNSDAAGTRAVCMMPLESANETVQRRLDTTSLWENTARPRSSLARTFGLAGSHGPGRTRDIETPNRDSFVQARAMPSRAATFLM
jgi:hypothetical protein